MKQASVRIGSNFHKKLKEIKIKTKKTLSTLIEEALAKKYGNHKNNQIDCKEEK